ncbi:hypothetical protein [Parabacteroides sp.]|uniref:hypothetical protein n=1 Tax=Parabacteroides sp. TaxID=1869337 RepID=UPI003080AD42
MKQVLHLYEDESDIVFPKQKRIFAIHKRKEFIMTQLIITLDDSVKLPDIKKALSLLRGIKHITVKKEEPNAETRKAMDNIKKGNTIKCNDFNDYLNKVK